MTIAISEQFLEKQDLLFEINYINNMLNSKKILYEENIIKTFQYFDKVQGPITIFIIIVAILSIILSQIPLVLARVYMDGYTKELRKIINDNKIKVYMIDHDEVNAFYAGTKAIYLTKAIINLLNRDEIMAVLIHEYGHRKHKHILKSVFIRTGGFTLIASVFVYLLKYTKINEVQAISGGLGVRWLFNVLINITVGRHFEYQADKMTTKYGYKHHLISAFQKFEKLMKSKICKGLNKSECEHAIQVAHRWDEHPTFSQRIEKLIINKIISFAKAFGSRGFYFSGLFLQKLGKFALKYPDKFISKYLI